MRIINSKSREWREIGCDDGPIEKRGCGMIPFRSNSHDYILVIGGCGHLPDNPPPHARYTSTLSKCLTNEVHIICVSTIPGQLKHFIAV